MFKFNPSNITVKVETILQDPYFGIEREIFLTLKDKFRPELFKGIKPKMHIVCSWLFNAKYTDPTIDSLRVCPDKGGEDLIQVMNMTDPNVWLVLGEKQELAGMFKTMYLVMNLSDVELIALRALWNKRMWPTKWEEIRMI